MGNKSLGAINGVDAVKEFYADMKKHRYVKIALTNYWRLGSASFGRAPTHAFSSLTWSL